MRLECRTQFFWWRQLAVPDRLERRIELIGGTVHNLPEQFFFARDVCVQTATLYPQGFGEVTHTGGVVAQLREELACSAVNLFFPGDGLGHVDTSLSDARAVLEKITPIVSYGKFCQTRSVLRWFKIKAGWFKPTCFVTIFEVWLRDIFDQLHLCRDHSLLPVQCCDIDNRARRVRRWDGKGFAGASVQIKGFIEVCAS
jgi:hypothetical protein